MSEFARCCRCNEAVRLPDATTVWVRCPHCRAEYTIDQILDQLPPALEAISAPASDSNPVAPVISAGVHHDAGEEVTLATETSGISLIARPKPQVTIDDAKAKVRSPETLRAERRKAVARRNAVSAPGSILKVALGGIAGLMIGQLILWWLPPPYRTDPLKLAPKLPRSLAFLVPESLRLVPLLTGERATGSETSEPVAEVPVVESDVLTSLDDAKPPAVEPNDTDRPQELVLGPSESPKFTVEELKQVLSSARDVDRDSDSESASQGEFTRQWYEPLCKLAYCVTFADTSAPGIWGFAKATRAFVGSFALQPKKQQALAAFATEDLRDTTQNRKGIVVCGNVKSVEQIGHFFETKIAAADGDGMIDVISRSDPRQKAYKAGDEVVILGVVVANPKLYLLGYQGDADAVVFGGLPVRLQ